MQGFFDRGEDAAGACKGLMEMANRRWSDMVGDYRDDITATVVKLPFLPPAAAAEALVMNVATANEGGATAASTIASGEEEVAAIAATSSPSAAREEVENRSDGVVEDTAEVEDSGARDAASPDGGCSGDALVGEGGGTGTELRRDGEYEEQERGHGAAVAAVVDDGGAAVSEGSASAPEGATRADVSKDEVGQGPSARGGDGRGDHQEAGGVKGFSEIPQEALAARMTGAGGSTAPPLAPAFSPAAVPTAATAGAGESATADDDEGDVSTQEGADFFDDVEEDDEEGLMGKGEEGEEWEWDFGARENRQPSREIREASREFPSRSLDALVAGADSSSSQRD